MKTITRQELKAKLDVGADIKLVMTVGGVDLPGQTYFWLGELPQPQLRAAGVALRR
jgi:hypothetical protein